MNKKDRDLERQRIMENFNKQIEAREKGDKKVNDSLKLRAIKEYYKFAEDQRKAGAVIDLKFFEKEYERILQQTIEEHKRWLAGEDTREKGDKNVNEPIFKNVNPLSFPGDLGKPQSTKESNSYNNDQESSLGQRMAEYYKEQEDKEKSYRAEALERLRYIDRSDPQDARAFDVLDGMEVVKILEEANEYLAQNTGVVKTVQGTTKHYTGWSETKPHSLSSPGGGGAGPVIHTSYTETIRHDSWASYRYAGHILAYPKVGFIYAGFIADEDKEYDMFVVAGRTTGRVIGKLHEVPGIEHVKEMDLRKHIEPPYRSIPKAVAALRFDQKQGLYAGIDLRSQYKEARDQLDNALPPIIDKHYKWTQVPVVEDDPEPEPYIYPLDPWNDRFDRRGRRRDPYLP